MEDLFRNEFSEYSISPSEGSWNRLAKKLSFREFFVFSASSFNVFYLTLILAVLAGGLTLINSNKNRTGDNSQSIINITTVENASQLDESGQPQEKQLVKSATFKTPTDSDNGKSIEKYSSRSSTDLNEKIVKKEQPDVIQSKVESNNKALSSSSGSFQSEINKPVLRPKARYLVNVKSGCVPLTVRFINTSENAGRYEWQFGDGGVSTKENPSYVFDEPGEYQVQLTASSSVGVDVFEYEVIRVFERPEANFEIYPSDVLIPRDPVNFHNYSRNAVHYEWSFGDGAGSTIFEPTHYYSKTGSYNITLKVWSEAGCKDTITITNAFENSVYEIRFPNAFAANPNGPSNGYYTRGLTTNEVFHPVYKGVAEYHLKIYDRFGILVFESNDINIGWDGYINDHLAKQGVYIWKTRGSYINGQTYVKFGNVTLIKK